MVKKVARYVSAGLLLTPVVNDAVAHAGEPEPDSSTPIDSAIAPRSSAEAIATPAISQPETISQPIRAASPNRFVPSPVSQSSQPEAPPSQSARVGVGHTSSGGGFDGITRFEGFLPLFQTPGRDLAFLEGRLLLDNDAHLGSNVVLGYRTYSPEAERTFGGYIAYDSRDTDHNSFDQFGVGLESLGNLWDFRANAYIPVGDRQQQVGASQLVNTFFRERSLILQERTQVEAAVGGADLEAGVRLATLGNRGDLRGYGGLYWYSAAGGDDGLGWRLRLEARPNDSLNFGVGVQQDDLFGTNVVARVGITFPGRRPRSRTPQNTVIARLGESVERNPTIAISSQTEEREAIATNPNTGRPYVFQHVSAGARSGNGTIENPYGTVQPALAAAQSDGNHIVYVQPGRNPGIPGFTIPDRVQVLSSAPVQQLVTSEFGAVQLPLSGGGVRPIITNTVTLGNSTTLAGFDITGTTGPGAIARNVGDVVLQDNSITSIAGAGLVLENTSETVTITGSTIAATGSPALVGTGVNTVQITDSSLSSSSSGTSGIIIDGVQEEINIRNTAIVITNPLDDGIVLSNVTGVAALAVAPGSAIANPANAGVRIQSSPGAVSVSGLQITDTGTDGIVADSVGNVSIRENAIASSANNGIALSNITSSTDISNNSISTSGATGISLTAAAGNITLSDNTIDVSVADGIQLTNITASSTISENTINFAGTNGISLITVNGSTTVSNNTMVSPALDGINLTEVTGSTSISGNTITEPGQDGIEVNSSAEQTGLSLLNNQISGAGAIDINIPTNIPAPTNTNLSN